MISSIISFAAGQQSQVCFYWQINTISSSSSAGPPVLNQSVESSNCYFYISMWPKLLLELYIYIYLSVNLSNELNNTEYYRANRFRFFQPKLFQILYWTKLIIFNQCFLSNCWISIEDINTSNGPDLLQQPTFTLLTWWLLPSVVFTLSG